MHKGGNIGVEGVQISTILYFLLSKNIKKPYSKVLSTLSAQSRKYESWSYSVMVTLKVLTIFSIVTCSALTI
jgi:hypothetical protein